MAVKFIDSVHEKLGAPFLLGWSRPTAETILGVAAIVGLQTIE